MADYDFAIFPNRVRLIVEDSSQPIPKDRSGFVKAYRHGSFSSFTNSMGKLRQPQLSYTSAFFEDKNRGFA
jgi:hypothetical protein